jgi:hypothetical protein
MLRRTHRQAHNSKHLRLQDFRLDEIMTFLAGWFPPRPQDPPTVSRWSHWEEFLTAYQEIRGELFDHFRSAPGTRDRPVFAERVSRLVAAHGLAALKEFRCFEYLIAALDWADDDDANQDEPT